MFPIDATSVGIESAADFATALAMPTITHLYLANNITLTGGVTIPPDRPFLVFDGEYPIDSGARNELIDVIGTSADQTLGIRATSGIELTFRNMVITGRNYYGVPYITDSILYDTSSVIVNYENVVYRGRQITFHCNGLTRYIDCDITIENTNGASEEVGEVNRVELGGNTTIRHASLRNGDDFAVFWFRGAAATMSLNVLADAQVSIRSENCYFMYNADPLVGTPHPLPLILWGNASLSVEVYLGFAYNSNQQLSVLHLEEGAAFRYVQTASNGTAASFYIAGALSVTPGTRFYMEAQNGTRPLVQFVGLSSLMVSSPLSFVLYSPGSAALAGATPTNFVLDSGQVNTWTTPIVPAADAGGFDDEPGNKWHRLAYAQNVVLNGTFTQTATTTQGNLVTEDEPYPALTNLHLHEARALSAGDWPVTVDPVEDSGIPITGVTVPGANIRVIYEIEEVEHRMESVAEEDGSFSFSTAQEDPPNIPAGTAVAVWTNIPFLIKDTELTAIHVGSLRITDAPEGIVFHFPPISLDPLLLPRVEPEIRVVIEDDRDEESTWTLLAATSGPLQTAAGDILPDAVVYIAQQGQAPVSLGDTPYPVYAGGPERGTTEVTWLETAGIFVHVTAPMQMGERYFTQLIWEVLPDQPE